MIAPGTWTQIGFTVEPSGVELFRNGVMYNYTTNGVSVPGVTASNTVIAIGVSHTRIDTYNG